MSVNKGKGVRPLDRGFTGLLNAEEQSEAVTAVLTAAIKLADELIEEQNLETPNDPSGQTAKAMLERLKSFGVSHYKFFSDGFSNQSLAQLEESHYFPPEAVCSKILFQIQEDLEIIVRAMQQRRVKFFRDKLREADELAYGILNQAQMNLALPKVGDSTNSLSQLGENYGVLSYFQKSHEIRMIPYAPVALVAIPFTALSQPRDLLALPHEVGHYVFGHRPTNPETDSMDGSYVIGKPKYAHWQEEVYADVFGALFGGAIMAFDFQELAKQSYQGIFESRNDDHPDPYLRPLIYTYALRMRGDATEKRIANLLDKRWSDYLLARWSKETGIEGLPNLQEFKTEIHKRAELIEGPLEKLKRPQYHIKMIDKAFQDLTFIDGRLELGNHPREIVTAALNLLSGRGDWSGPKEAFEEALKLNSDDPDAWFRKNWAELRHKPEASAPEASAPEAQVASRVDLSEIWYEWLVSEQLMDKATADRIRMQDGPPVEFGVGDDQPDFFKQPANPPAKAAKKLDSASEEDSKPTWQGIWFAGRWATDPSGVPAGGQP